MCEKLITKQKPRRKSDFVLVSRCNNVSSDEDALLMAASRC